jgi:hypothetical protein
MLTQIYGLAWTMEQKLSCKACNLAKLHEKCLKELKSENRNDEYRLFGRTHDFVHLVCHVGENIVQELHVAYFRRQHNPQLRVGGFHLSVYSCLQNRQHTRQLPGETDRILPFTSPKLMCSHFSEISVCPLSSVTLKN